MDIFKKMISQSTGIPEDLLAGETAEEAIAQAKALLAFKRSFQQEDPKSQAAAAPLSTRDQFAAWMSGQLGGDPGEDPQPGGDPAPAPAAYPQLQDGGEAPAPKGTPFEVFEAWARDYF